ncbi:phosphatase PAP2 family protein [uncultured Pseudokineococcus sp.]|uniref:phosphatase PAP2 family protein n=1 Tax=uncultured Pseudokineococcus sp. TaxID=1642928 RepID=UPI0026315DA0|nr:phosphatase PAP2 family protein [uncultured Pseudokineococcus sp.]
MRTGPPRDDAPAGPVLPLLLALLAAAGVVGLWLGFVTTGPGQVVDEIAFAGSARGRDLLDDQAMTVLSVVSEGTLALGLLLLVVLAVLRRRLPLAVASVLVVGGANVSTQLLKKVLLERPDLGLGDANSLPSGHTTVAATLAVALVLVVPVAVRSTAAVLGAVYAAATGVSTLVAGWHRPSDVAAALLVVAAWTGLAVAGLRLHGGAPVRGPDRRAVWVLLVAAGSAAVLVGLAAMTAAALVLDAGGTVVVESAGQDAGRTVQLLSYAGGVLAGAGGSAALLGTSLALLHRTPA